jgi:hypothetical protein
VVIACAVLPARVVESIGVGVVASESADVEAVEARSTPLMHAGKMMLESPLILLLPAGISRL